MIHRHRTPCFLLVACLAKHDTVLARALFADSMVVTSGNGRLWSIVAMHIGPAPD